MPWTPPRTWSPGETVTASLMNAQIRDNSNVLKANIDDAGYLMTLLKGFAYSAGQANDAGGSDTQLTSYDITVPANALAQPGDMLIIDGTLILAANANAKTVKIKLGGGNLVTILSTAANVVNHIATFRTLLRRRTSGSGSITGLAAFGAAAGGVPSLYLANAAAGSVDFTTSQTLAVFAAGASAGDVRLSDYSVNLARGGAGGTV